MTRAAPGDASLAQGGALHYNDSGPAGRSTIPARRGRAYLPITNLPTETRAYTLTGLTNYVWYTVTLNAMSGSASFLTDMVKVMPSDIFVYLPLVLRDN